MCFVLLSIPSKTDLISALESVLKAVKRSQLTSQGFFQSLQGVVTQANVGSSKINFKVAKRLADSGLLPDWIGSLPYTSNLLSMNDDEFAALSAEERSSLELEIESKLQLYREINENSDLWVALDKRDSNNDHVYPLPLSVLP